MISFFYTFDYDDNITVESPPNIKSERPESTIQMNAHVYALADKYQVDDLKALAVEKLKTSVDLTSRHQMLAAAWTVGKVLKLPPGDQTLQQMLSRMWLLGSPEWIDAADADGMTVIAAFCDEMPEFTASLLGTFATAAKNGTVRYTCSACKRQETIPMSKFLTTAYRCKNCGSTVPTSVVTINGPVAIERFW